MPLLLNVPPFTNTQYRSDSDCTPSSIIVEYDDLHPLLRRLWSIR